MRSSYPHRPNALLLQGPVGGFFASLKRGLERAGWRVRKINFNGGDCLFSRGEACLAFDGNATEFATWMNIFCREDRPDVIFMFGDRRPIHIAAIKVAERHGIPVWSFEEGYLRPDYVAFERGGNNARSCMPREPSAYVARSPAQGGGSVSVGSTFFPMALRATAYYAAMAGMRSFFARYTHHRQRSMAAEMAFWALSLARKVRGVPSRALVRRIIATRCNRYFVFAAQVHDDLQVVHHGRGWTVPEAIDAAIRSFVRAAPSDCSLIVKVHPLARGHFNHKHLLAECLRGKGCEDRVVLVDDGAMGPLAQHCAGLITINSTSGLSALHHGRPVAVLGDTFYAIQGLAQRIDHEQALDAFWSAPMKPDAELWRAFRATMIREALLPGSFYVPATWPTLVEEVIARVSLENATATWRGLAPRFPNQSLVLSEGFTT